jgi:hypothetical protein
MKKNHNKRRKHIKLCLGLQYITDTFLFFYIKKNLNIKKT